MDILWVKEYSPFKLLKLSLLTKAIEITEVKRELLRAKGRS